MTWLSGLTSGERNGRREDCLCQGYGHLLNGDFEQAELDVQEGITRLTATGSPLALYQFHTTLAEISLRRGNSEKALTRIEEALHFASGCLNRFMLAETHRIKGEILLTLSDRNTEPARAEFQTALEIARQQKARQLELRSAMSLTRLWQADSQGDDPRPALQSAHDWFGTALDLPDLIDARNLLASS